MADSPGWPRSTENSECARLSPSTYRSGERGGGATPCSRCSNSASFQIACGYEDQNDSDFLRSDPLLKVACGVLPDSGEDLASQPTICRMENAVDARACYRIAEALAKVYIAQRGKDGVPGKIL